MVVVAGWVRDWFAGSVRPVIAPLVNRSEDGVDRQNAHGDWSLGCAEAAAVAVGVALAGVGSGGLLTARDRALLGQAGWAAFEDLSFRFNDFSGSNTLAGGEQTQRFLLTDRAAGWSAMVSAPQAALVRLRRVVTRLGDTIPAPKLSPIAQALARQSITLGALVGTTRLPIGAARDLAVGDVLLFDRATTDPLPLAIDGRATQSGSIRLRPDEDGIAMIVDRPVAATAANRPT